MTVGLALPRRRSRAAGPLLDAAARTMLVAAALALLQVLEVTKVVTSTLIPRPSTVLSDVAGGVVGGSLDSPLATTLGEAAVATALSTVGGVGIGYLLWRFTAFGRAYEPVLGGLLASPVILLYPIALVIFGRTTVAVTVLGLSLGLPTVALYALRGFLGVPGVLLKVAATSRSSRWQTLRMVLLPAAAPTIFTGVRLGVTAVLISEIGLEYLAQIGGLGKVIAVRYLTFDIAGVYAAVVLVLLVTAALIAAIGRLELAARR